MEPEETVEAIKNVGHVELEEILSRYAEARLKGDQNADDIVSEAEGHRDELSKTPEGRETLKRLRAAIMSILNYAN